MSAASEAVRPDAAPPPALARLLASGPGRLGARLAVLASFVAVWQFAPGRAARFWVSSPAGIAATLWHWIVTGSLWEHLAATLVAMGLGYAIGCGAGVGLGLVFGFLPRCHRVVAPYISALYALPKIALAPLFIIFFGTGLSSKVALVAITVFFLVLNSTLDGVNSVDRDTVQSLRLMGATRVETIRKVLIPSALPWIFTGMRISVRYAFTNTVLAELIAANRGIGFLIEYYSGIFDSTGTYAAILVLVLFSVVLTELLTRLEGLIGRGRR